MVDDNAVIFFFLLDKPIFVQSSRGKLNLWLNGYRYFPNCITKRSISWRCSSYSKTNCSCRVITVDGKIKPSQKKRDMQWLYHNH